MPDQDLMKLLPWVLGGTGVAALENKLVGENLPDELKHVNLGIGGVSGLLAANPAHRAQVLGSLPFKQMGLFGIGAIDRLREQQQNLTDTNLATAKIHRQTAALEGSNAGSHNKLMAAFLIPALLGGGALAYHAYGQRKKKRAEGFKTVDERGTPNHARKIRIDVPSSALPPEFFSSLMHADDLPRSRTRVMEKAATYNGGEGIGSAFNDSFLGNLWQGAKRVPGAILGSEAATNAGNVGNLGWELTGLPTAGRTAKDISLGLGSQSGGNESGGGRYLAAGLGGMLLSGAALKSGILPAMAKLVGKGRLARMVKPNTFGKALRYPITGMPNISSLLSSTIAGRALSAAEHAALDNPATRDATFRSLKGTLGGDRHLIDKMRDLKYQYNPRAYVPGRTPTTLGGEAMQAGGRALHGVNETARRGYNFVRRNPYGSATVAGLPLASMGTLRDEDKYREYLANNKPLLANENHGPWNMPLSSQLAAILSNAGGGGSGGALSGQLKGWAGNSYDLANR